MKSCLYKQIIYWAEFCKHFNERVTAAIVQRLARNYGLPLSHIFEIPSFQMRNLVFLSKLKFRTGNFEILGFSHFELEISGISRKILVS